MYSKKHAVSTHKASISYFHEGLRDRVSPLSSNAHRPSLLSWSGAWCSANRAPRTGPLTCTEDEHQQHVHKHQQRDHREHRARLYIQGHGAALRADMAPSVAAVCALGDGRYSQDPQYKKCIYTYACIIGTYCVQLICKTSLWTRRYTSSLGEPSLYTFTFTTCWGALTEPDTRNNASWLRLIIIGGSRQGPTGASAPVSLVMQAASLWLKMLYATVDSHIHNYQLFNKRWLIISQVSVLIKIILNRFQLSCNFIYCIFLETALLISVSSCN